ncbi:unnamed protein product [marine sediment metagenome]|uniref:Uncharacterized protein n=1 Tax=marine sediment metagenome TaxID=412755 RepID=X0SUH7_9ZZZZ
MTTPHYETFCTSSSIDLCYSYEKPDCPKTCNFAIDKLRNEQPIVIKSGLERFLGKFKNWNKHSSINQSIEDNSA